MSKVIDIAVAPERLQDESHLRALIHGQLDLPKDSVPEFRVLKRSLDARSKQILYRLRVEVAVEEQLSHSAIKRHYQSVDSTKKTVHIIGAGPAGLFAALHCLELGLRPVLIERGKDVRARRRDLAALNKEHIVNPESNYCFGEGGAGAYSDGKLYTRSKKRGDVNAVLETLVHFGASRDILIDAHPHIGTNKLPGIISAMREHIIECGGEVRFENKLTDIQVTEGKIDSITLNGREEEQVEHLILATGHSARDIFQLCVDRGITIEQKDFALGVRVEHPQALIDSAQYRRKERGEHLPPASYNLVCQVGDTGVFSFCMCPGGIIAPCATAPGEVVTNGWSPSKRNNPYANSGIVVQVKSDDLKDYAHQGPLAGVAYQSAVEQRAWMLGGKTQTAPAQRLVDFVQGKVSNDLPDCSYFPGITSVHLGQVLPKRIHKALQAGFKDFGRKMHGYFSNEAVVVATESRTSSPVRIPRDRTSLEHTEVAGLYPCGEGAGYAGGIVSAAIDGQRCVQAIAVKLGIS